MVASMTLVTDRQAPMTDFRVTDVRVVGQGGPRLEENTRSAFRVECPHCGSDLDFVDVKTSLERGWTLREIKLRLSELGGTFDQVIERLTHILVLGALQETRGIKSHAADILGIKRTTFDLLVRRLGITNGDLSKVKERSNRGIAIRVDRLHLNQSNEHGRLELHLDLRSFDGTLDETLDNVRRELVLEALRDAGGLQNRAAENLGIKRSTFNCLVRRLGIT